MMFISCNTQRGLRAVIPRLNIVVRKRQSKVTIIGDTEVAVSDDSSPHKGKHSKYKVWYIRMYIYYILCRVLLYS
jgi:hypothetical protein